MGLDDLFVDLNYTMKRFNLIYLDDLRCKIPDVDEAPKARSKKLAESYAM